MPLNEGYTYYEKYKMCNEEGIVINLENEYNGIFSFAKGVAVVCIRKNPIIIQTENGERAKDDRKDGLIDHNGKELLPCIFDSISIKLDGFVEIIKDGQHKATNVFKILNGKFNWDKAIDWK